MDSGAAALERAVYDWGELGWPRPRVLLVSGSGLAVDLEPAGDRRLALSDLLPFPIHAIEGHPLTVELLLPREDRPVLYQRGRLHAYQGYEPWQVVFMVRLAALLGAEVLLMTNAAGGLRRSQRPGDLALIRDQLNLTGLNPLRGELPAHWGPRFPDMTAAHDSELGRLASATAAGLGISLGSGVYAGLAGPSYETAAEVEMLRRLGADLAGMSTVLEVIAAHHMGLRCLCLSLVSNLAAGATAAALDHAEVLDAGRQAAGKVRQLLAALLEAPGLLRGGAAGPG